MEKLMSHSLLSEWIEIADDLEGELEDLSHSLLSEWIEISIFCNPPYETKVSLFIE